MNELLKEEMQNQALDQHNFLVKGYALLLILKENYSTPKIPKLIKISKMSSVQFYLRYLASFLNFWWHQRYSAEFQSFLHISNGFWI